MSAGGRPAGLYGRWDAEVVPEPSDAVQFAPFVPGSDALEDRPAGSLSAMTMLAPPGTLERRAALALALRALAPGGRLTAFAPNGKGGTRLAAELDGFGCTVERASRRHHRICSTARPDRPTGLDEAIADGAERWVEPLGAWSRPGVFSWDRVDPGTALLSDTLPALSGRGADLGSGIGLLARRVLAGPAVTALALVEIDSRAVACARRNLDDGRAVFHWADARRIALEGLDFVVANPPFHSPSGTEDQGLGQAFLRAAAAALRRGGTAYVVANRHLAYEAVLRELFRQVTPLAERDGFKVLRAQR